MPEWATLDETQIARLQRLVPDWCRVSAETDPYNGNPVVCFRASSTSGSVFTVDMAFRGAELDLPLLIIKQRWLDPVVNCLGGAILHQEYPDAEGLPMRQAQAIVGGGDLSDRDKEILTRQEGLEPVKDYVVDTRDPKIAALFGSAGDALK